MTFFPLLPFICNTFATDSFLFCPNCNFLGVVGVHFFHFSSKTHFTRSFIKLTRRFISHADFYTKAWTHLSLMCTATSHYYYIVLYTYAQSSNTSPTDFCYCDECVSWNVLPHFLQISLLTSVVGERRHNTKRAFNIMFHLEHLSMRVHCLKYTWIFKKLRKESLHQRGMCSCLSWLLKLFMVMMMQM